MRTAVNMIVKALCKGRIPFCCVQHLCDALANFPALNCNNFSCSCTPSVLYCPQLAATRAILVNSCNSGDKCNCQNNKCFFAVCLGNIPSPILSSIAPLCSLQCVLSVVTPHECSLTEAQCKGSLIKCVVNQMIDISSMCFIERIMTLTDLCSCSGCLCSLKKGNPRLTVSSYEYLLVFRLQLYSILKSDWSGMWLLLPIDTTYY